MRFKQEKTEKVTLLQRIEGVGEFGEPIFTWGNPVTIYMEFLDRHGKEVESDGQLIAMQDVRGKMRYRSALDPNIDGNKPERDYRIERGTTIYDVQSVAPQGRREELLLILQRRDNT